MNRIKELRVINNLTQKELGEELGVNQTAVGKYERGELEPNINVIYKLCKLFLVSSDYLLGLEDDFGVKQFNETQSATLTSDEKRLLEAFNRLNDLEKKKLIDDAEFYANRHVRTHERTSIKK